MGKGMVSVGYMYRVCVYVSCVCVYDVYTYVYDMSIRLMRIDSSGLLRCVKPSTT